MSILEITSNEKSVLAAVALKKAFAKLLPGKYAVAHLTDEVSVQLTDDLEFRACGCVYILDEWYLSHAMLSLRQIENGVHNPTAICRILDAIHNKVMCETEHHTVQKVTLEQMFEQAFEQSI